MWKFIHRWDLHNVKPFYVTWQHLWGNMIVLSAEMGSVWKQWSTFLLCSKASFLEEFTKLQSLGLHTKLTEEGNVIRLVPVNKMLQKTDFILEKTTQRCLNNTQLNKNMTVKQQKLFDKSKVWINSRFDGLARSVLQEEGSKDHLYDRYRTASHKPKVHTGKRNSTSLLIFTLQRRKVAFRLPSAHFKPTAQQRR